MSRDGTITYSVPRLMTAIRRLSVIARSSESYCSCVSCAISVGLPDLIGLAREPMLIDLDGHELWSERRHGGPHVVHVVLTSDHEHTPAARRAERLAAARARGASPLENRIDQWRRDRRMERPLMLPVLPHELAELVDVVLAQLVRHHPGERLHSAEGLQHATVPGAVGAKDRGDG